MENLDLPKIPYPLLEKEIKAGSSEKKLAKCQRALGTSFLFKVDVLPDFRNRSKNMITFVKGSTKHLTSR